MHSNVFCFHAKSHKNNQMVLKTVKFHDFHELYWQSDRNFQNFIKINGSYDLLLDLVKTQRILDTPPSKPPAS